MHNGFWAGGGIDDGVGKVQGTGIGRTRLERASIEFRNCVHAAEHRPQDQTNLLSVSHLQRPTRVFQCHLRCGGYQSRRPVKRAQVDLAQIFRRIEINDLSAERAAKSRTVEKLYGLNSAE